MTRLKKSLRECEAATENLLKALEVGEAADIITKRLVQKQNEAHELRELIAKEELIYSDFSIDKIKFFLYSLKQGDINDTKYRKALINLFINREYLFDDKMTVLYNTDKNLVEVTIDLLDDLGIGGGSSDVNQTPVKHTKTEPTKIYFYQWAVWCCY